MPSFDQLHWTRCFSFIHSSLRSNSRSYKKNAQSATRMQFTEYSTFYVGQLSRMAQQGQERGEESRREQGDDAGELLLTTLRPRRVSLPMEAPYSPRLNARRITTADNDGRKMSDFVLKLPANAAAALGVSAGEGDEAARSLQARGTEPESSHDTSPTCDTSFVTPPASPARRTSSPLRVCPLTPSSPASPGSPGGPGGGNGRQARLVLSPRRRARSATKAKDVRWLDRVVRYRTLVARPADMHALRKKKLGRTTYTTLVVHGGQVLGSQTEYYIPAPTG